MKKQQLIKRINFMKAQQEQRNKIKYEDPNSKTKRPDNRTY